MANRFAELLLPLCARDAKVLQDVGMNRNGVGADVPTAVFWNASALQCVARWSLGLWMRLTLRKLRVLTRGGMARLSLAQLGDGTCVVIRELHLRHVFHWRTHMRFVNGLRMHEQLSPHPNIVGYFERSYSGFTPYEVIEYVNGCSMRDLINPREPLPYEDVLPMLVQAGEALCHVHAKGMVHLDVKPANFLVSRQNGDVRVKLADFDLCCDSGQTRDRRRAGTTYYMAPEQLKHGDIGVEADIFAFGVTAFFLLTGRKPFDAETMRQMKRQQVSESFKATNPCEINKSVPARMGKLVIDCLAKRMVERVPTMRYAVRELESL